MITHNLALVSDVLSELPPSMKRTGRRLELRGEVFMEQAEFERDLAALQRHAEPFRHRFERLQKIAGLVDLVDDLALTVTDLDEDLDSLDDGLDDDLDGLDDRLDRDLGDAGANAPTSAPTAKD